jgi:iron complex outermembrane recepter protein
VFGPGTWAAYLAQHPHAYPGGIDAFLSLQNSRGPFLIDEDGSNAHWANDTLVSNITTIDLNSHMQLRNVVGYNDLKSDDYTDVDGSPLWDRR